jgi:hypothetical protein
MITPLFVGEANTALSQIVALQNLGIGRDEASLQVDITGTATVVVRGRLSNSAAWQDLKTITASDLQPVYRVPYLQLEITANTGSVSAFIAS